MQQQSKLIQIKSVRHWKEKNSLCLVNELGQMHVLSVNFVKHILGIPYTKKDGTQVTKEMIEASRKRPQRKFSYGGGSYVPNFAKSSY